MTQPQQQVKEILVQRGNRYGTFKDNANTTQTIKQAFQCAPNWTTLAPFHKESLEMIAHKIARILNGDPDYDDSWVDIAGYAQLVVDIIRGKDSNAN